MVNGIYSILCLPFPPLAILLHQSPIHSNTICRYFVLILPLSLFPPCCLYASTVSNSAGIYSILTTCTKLQLILMGFHALIKLLNQLEQKLALIGTSYFSMARFILQSLNSDFGGATVLRTIYFSRGKVKMEKTLQ